MTISATTQGLRPGVCTSSNRPATPFEGQMIYETDTDKVLVYNGSAWLYLSTPQTTEIGGAWVTFTPTWTASTTNPVLGNGSISGRYCQINKLVLAEYYLVMGSTTTFGSGIYSFSFPITQVATLGLYNNLGSGVAFDISAANAYVIAANNLNANTSSFSGRFTGAGNGDLTSIAPFTFANTDIITFSIQYQVA